MRRDWEEYLASFPGGAGGKRAPPDLDAVWFEAARRELRRRGAIPHRGEEHVPVLLGSGIALRCGFCEGDEDD